MSARTVSVPYPVAIGMHDGMICLEYEITEANKKMAQGVASGMFEDDAECRRDLELVMQGQERKAE